MKYKIMSNTDIIKKIKYKKKEFEIKHKILINTYIIKEIQYKKEKKLR